MTIQELEIGDWFSFSSDEDDSVCIIIGINTCIDFLYLTGEKKGEIWHLPISLTKEIKFISNFYAMQDYKGYVSIDNQAIGTICFLDAEKWKNSKCAFIKTSHSTYYCFMSWDKTCAKENSFITVPDGTEIFVSAAHFQFPEIETYL